MNTRRCLRIAERIHVLTRGQLGIGIDAPRMLADKLYARDVLLVCDAQHGSDLAVLSQHFRVAANERNDDSSAPSTWGQDSSSFESSTSPGVLQARPSQFGTTPAAQAGKAERARLWFSPYRWTDGK
jgi:hypothetical protein